MEARKVISKQEREAVYKIRIAVFVDEQGVPLEDELDQYEEEAEHIIVMDEDQPVGAARWRIVDGIAKFERICVLPSHRKLGLGKLIVEALEESAKEKGLSKAKLHGQTHAEVFYHKLGYGTASDIFMEDGIPHIVMTKVL